MRRERITISNDNQYIEEDILMTAADNISTIGTEYQGSILRITINRPEKKNALTGDMYLALRDAVNQAEQDANIRVILLHGTEDCFTSGNDLQDFAKTPRSGEPSPVSQFLAALSRAKKPVVAAVNGPAVGIGTTMLLHCDLVYAGTSARFQLPFVNLGLCPEAASSFLLPKLVGYQRAAELLLLGEPFSAEKAQEMGLVNGVYPNAELLQNALAQAQKLAAQPPASVRLTKMLLKKAGAKAVAETMEEERRLFAKRLLSPEASEAFSAFFERRKPDFSSFK
jgi:enoyl-CoA hydratase/carnithine racemase